MAFTPTQNLSNISTDVILRDPQHAARLFVDDRFRLAPKFNFLFHVAFKLNQAALMNPELAQRHSTEIDMLVKNCDLPSFQVRSETLNQYNRKKNVQYTHSYQPINITFHDDNMGLINQLWHNYYNYYYADPSSAKDPGAYDRNAIKKFSYIQNTYGLDNNSTAPFFKYIKIYQMARHEYVEYKLYNPIITSWNHNRLDYANSLVHDNTMQISYEAVSYSYGKVEDGKIEGFGTEHYDQTPSPLTATDTITTTSPTFSDTASREGLLDTVTTSVNSYQNSINPTTTSGIPNVIGTANQTASNGVNGLQGVVFPGTQLDSAIRTDASPITF